MSQMDRVGNRWRLASLWLSQSLHFFANYGLRIAVVFELAKTGESGRAAAFHLSSAAFMAPSILLVPLSGAIGNSVPKRAALIGSAAFCAAATSVLAGAQTGWLASLAFVAIGSSLYTPTRFAVLPAAAADTGWPLQRILSAIETGSVLAMVAGMLATGALYGAAWDLALPPPALTALAAAHLLSTAFALPAAFPSDVYRPDSPLDALKGFRDDSRRIANVFATRGSLLALAALRGIVTAATGAFVARALEGAAGDSRAAFRALMGVAIFAILGAAVGSLIAGVGSSPERSLRWSPAAVAGMLAAIVWAALVDDVPLSLCFAVGVCGGVVNVPLLATYQKHLPADARGNGMALLNTAGYLSMTLLSALFATLAHFARLTPTGQFWLVAGLVALALAGSFWFRFRSTATAEARSER